MKSTNRDIDMAYLPDDPALAIGSIISLERIISRLQDAESNLHLSPQDLKISHIRYSQGKSCVVAYEHPARSERSLPWLAYAKMYTAGAYRRHRDRALRKSSIAGTGTVSAWDDLNTLYYTFPADAKLSIAPFVHSSSCPMLNSESREQGVSSHWLDGSTVVRWKPESRCLLKVPVRRDRPGTDESADFVCLRINRTNRLPEQRTWPTLKAPSPLEHVAGPPTLFRDDETGVRIQPWLTSTGLLDLLKGTDAAAWAELAGKVLASWHAQSGTRLPVQSEELAVRRARGLVNDLVLHDIEGSTDCDDLLGRLNELNRSSNSQCLSVLHGDFHPGQLLMSPKSAWILDTDGMCLGDPAIDLGNFAAQVKLHEGRKSISEAHDILPAFISGYSSATRCRVPSDRIALWCAAGFLELAIKQVRRLRPDWKERSARYLYMAKDLVSRDRAGIVAP